MVAPILLMKIEELTKSKVDFPIVPSNQASTSFVITKSEC